MIIIRIIVRSRAINPSLSWITLFKPCFIWIRNKGLIQSFYASDKRFLGYQGKVTQINNAQIIKSGSTIVIKPNFELL